MKFKQILCVATSLTVIGAATTAAAEPVHYRLRITHAAQHLAEVTTCFPATGGREFPVHLPVWRTGRYEILPLANAIRQFVATGKGGRALPVRKTDKSTWLIDKEPDEPVTVRYELYANELGLRTRHIDDSHAYLNASAVWVYHPEFRRNPVSVTLTVPDGWKSRSGMKQSGGEHSFRAANYDELTDSPIETGLQDFHSFEVDGKTIELALWGPGNYDATQILGDLKKIVATTGNVFGSYPFERYLFIVHATSGETGATEHLNSTVIQWPRWGFSPRKDYLKFARISTHEFFHTWNVKGYRPAAMVPYDFQRENYSELLWIVEGHTSYFDNLLTLRAGVQTRDEYLEELGRIMEDYLRQPGRLYQSALDSSFDEWIQPEGGHARNSSVSIYTKGEMLALAMDLTLRQRSQGKVGLEDLHNQLWQTRSVAAGGYTSADVKAILNELIHYDWELCWKEYIAGTQELPLTALLEAVGLELRADPDNEEKAQVEAWWGWTVKEGGADQFAVVSHVERDSPAWKAGIASQDTIVALDKLKVSAKDFVSRAAGFINGPVQVTLFRRDQLHNVTVSPALREKGKRKLKALPSVYAEQELLNNQWLSVP